MTAGLLSRRALQALSLLAILLAVSLLALRVLTRPPFFDEIYHAHFLWLLSQGLHPYVDYRCGYPQLGYILTLPFFRLLPESAFNLFALRAFTLLLSGGLVALLVAHGRRLTRHWLWGLAPALLLATAPPVSRFWAEYNVDHFAMLAAGAAMYLMFRKPTATRLSAAALLCVWSVAFTPKYGIILACGGLAWAASAIRQRPAAWSTTLWAGVGGAVAGLASVWLLYALAGASFPQSLYWAFYIQSLYAGQYAARGPLWLALLRFLVVYWPTGLALGMGIWIWLVKRGHAPIRWARAGLLAGIAIYAIVVRQLLEQYYTPILVTLAFFAPYLFVLARARGWARRGAWALAVFTTVVLATRLVMALPERHITLMNVRDEHPPGIEVKWGPPAFMVLQFTQAFLDTIPPEERFVAVGLFSPIFRRDATFITSDERPSVLSVLPADHAIRRYYDPAYFRDELEKRPPAMISLALMDVNYPPGWKEVAQDFLRSHGASYRQVAGSPAEVFIRRDLRIAPVLLR